MNDAFPMQGNSHLGYNVVVAIVLEMSQNSKFSGNLKKALIFYSLYEHNFQLKAMNQSVNKSYDRKCIIYAHEFGKVDLPKMS